MSETAAPPRQRRRIGPELLPAALNVVQGRVPNKPRQNLHQQCVAAGFVPLAAAPNAQPVVRVDGVLYG